MSRKTESMQAIDHHVGHKVKWYRAQAGLSQQELAAKLNISYQQLHKYENGSNSMSASRIMELCQLLDITVAHLFAGYGEDNANNDAVSELSKEQLNLIKNFNNISDKNQQKSLIALIHSLSD